MISKRALKEQIADLADLTEEIQGELKYCRDKLKVKKAIIADLELDVEMYKGAVAGKDERIAMLMGEKQRSYEVINSLNAKLRDIRKLAQPSNMVK